VKGREVIGKEGGQKTVVSVKGVKKNKYIYAQQK